MVDPMKAIFESAGRHSVVRSGRKIEQYHRGPENAASDHVGRAPTVHSTDDENRRRCHGGQETDAVAETVRKAFPGCRYRVRLQSR